MLILQYVYNLDPSLLNHLHWQYSLFHVKHLITYSASWRIETFIDNWVTLLLKTNYYLQHANSRLLRDIPPASAASWGSYSLLLAFQKSKVESFCIHVDWNKFHWKKKTILSLYSTNIGIFKRILCSGCLDLYVGCEMICSRLYILCTLYMFINSQMQF